MPKRDVARVHSVILTLRPLAAYGSTNKYRPVKRRKASGSNGEYVTQGGGIPSPDPDLIRAVEQYNERQ
jgi:hypothetical protein